MRLLTVIVLTTAIALSGCRGEPAGRLPGATPDATRDGAVTIATATPFAPPMPFATPTPPGPVPQSLRDFARQIQAALTAGDAAFFQSRARTVPVVCTVANTPPRGAGGPDCRTVGQQFDGFALGGWRSSGTLVPLEGAMETLSRLWTGVVPGASDKYGTSAPTVYAIGRANAEETAYTTVLTAMVERPPNFAGSGPLRAALVLTWTPQGNDHQLEFMLIAYVLAEDFLEPSLEGGAWMPAWERFSP